MVLPLPILIGATVLSVFILRAFWRKALPYQLAGLTAGWALCIVSLILWAQSAGWEFGIVYHLSTVSLTAWLLVSSNANLKPTRPQKAKANQRETFTPQRFANNATAFVLAGPLSGLAACICMLAFSQLLPTSQTNQLVFTGICFPILWGCLAVWVCYQKTLIKQTVAILSASLGSLGFLLL